MSYPRFLIALSVLMFVSAPVAHGEDEALPQWCDIYLPAHGSEPSCGSNEFLSTYPSKNDDPCTLCVPAHEPPSHTSLFCTRSGNQHQCEVWPQGAEGQFSYDWLATGSLSIQTDGSLDSPQQTVDCSSNPTLSEGFISVVVTSPYGLSTTKFIPLNCD